ncbi:MAG TPA: chemotaxis response regulator protein-glutamate methylesterase [Acetomicrobium hydrogeniformans]|uniref:Protein-glutamate methylesterase/protein-glutamine glutaminase n=2 Tax=Acetomicrobium hydrogeniformans TaxID=649746 RepID=A0A7V6ZE83_9BACT|nr:chemotaxis response regulator protein-glutamate methylesterase [Acetomicrobium hydrogeniformans]HHZ04354.1 chemotaxis response regulator protein-glutamate methylesterase [Acetomicrobium hydrogeniformans]
MSFTTRQVKVLVVDDSAFMRKIISDILEEDPKIKVIDRARDGKEAVEKTLKLDPDVITLDVEMPGMDGLAALKEIMRLKPTPVVMVSSLTRKGADTTMKALALGAVDFVAKPSGAISLDMKDVAQELREKVLIAASASVEKLIGIAPPTKEPVRPIQIKRKNIEVVAIAASTGGPRAIQNVLGNVKTTSIAPIVVVQHMPAGFTKSFAERLNEISILEVLEGYDNLQLKPGMVVIAPGGSHLIVEYNRAKQLICRLSDMPPLHSVKPAADLLFLSVADIVGNTSLGIILTGMGRDGAEGAKAIRQRGGYVIAESSDTCVIYGMPKAAVEKGAVDEVLPLHAIPIRIEELAAR